jgi:hypothetical protein
MIEINVAETVVLALVEALDKLEDTEIVELTAPLIFDLTNTCGLKEHAKVIKKYNVDGFNLVSTLSHIEVLKDIKTRFRDEDIAKLLELNYLYTAQDFRRTFLKQPKKKPPSPMGRSTLNPTIEIDSSLLEKR